MAFFPALGAAVLGIFATIILSGILAGIIAFGLIDARFRRDIQQRVVDKMIDQPVTDFLRERPELEYYPDTLPSGGSAYIILEKLTGTGEFRYGPSLLARGESLIAALVRLDPHHLFKLPYRQLCGQIANTLGAEAHDDDLDESSSRPRKRRLEIQPLTLALLVADQKNSGYFAFDLPHAQIPHPKVRALAYLDGVQIALANAVLVRARLIAAAIITLILISILIPNLGLFNLWAESSSVLSRSAGTIAAVIVATIMGYALVFAATVVAVLTFGWIDRYASAR